MPQRQKSGDGVDSDAVQRPILGAVTFAVAVEAQQQLLFQRIAGVEPDAAQAGPEIGERDLGYGQQADFAARAVANSPLVKTAVTGCDPNWGRILVAAGRAGVEFDQDACRLEIQGVTTFDRGVLPFDEAAVSTALGEPDVQLTLDLGAGSATATAWGCDLTVDYVRINADYRT